MSLLKYFKRIEPKKSEPEDQCSLPKTGGLLANLMPTSAIQAAVAWFPLEHSIATINNNDTSEAIYNNVNIYIYN